MMLDEGRMWLRGVVPAEDLDSLKQHSGLVARLGQRLPLQEFSNLLSSVTQRVSTVFPDARPVRVVGFNKNEDRNWKVGWHQDRIIEVAERHDVAGYGNWSCKAGAWHCEPPLKLLQGMLFLRVFLDDVDADNGGMVFACGSHAAGAVPTGAGRDIVGNYPCETEVAKAGDVLVLPMLTLHRSGRSDVSAPRRVLRVDYAFDTLPPPLRWAA